MSSAEALLRDIEAFLQRTGITPTQFGLEAMNNSSFVRQLRNGSGVTLRTLDKVRAFMTDWEKKNKRPSKGREMSRARAA
jgi:Tfp pilus assembly protein PilX